MRKMFLLFGVLALVGVLFVACTDEQATAPPEPTEEAAGPDFSFQFPGCEAAFEAARPEGKARALFRVFDGQIIAVSLVRQVRRNADYGRYDRAAAKAWQLADLVQAKLPGRLVDPCGSGPPTTEAGAAMLMNDVFELAGVELPAGGLPPAAFLPEGGFGTVTPGVPDTIWTNNDEAAFVANSGSFSGDGPVTVVLTRLADPEPGTLGVPIPPNFQAYPEAYDISANAFLVGEAEFWMCVLDDALPYPGKFDELVIGHDLGNGESELLPRLVEEYPGEVLDCSTAGSWSGPPAPPGGLVISALPAWLQYAGRVLEPVASQLLDVEPLNAMYFAGKGLGGRGGSLSPFAPVDVLDLNSLTVLVNGNTDAAGTVYDHVVNGTVSQGEILVTSFSCTLAEASCLIEAIPLGATVMLTAVFEAGSSGVVEWSGRCDGPGDGTACQFTMTEGDLIAGAYFRVFNTMTVSSTGGGTGVITGGNGINCTWDGTANAGQCQTSVEPWVNLTLNATPSSNSVFAGWSGACTGTSVCSVPMDSDKAVTASFSENTGVIGSSLVITITGVGGPTTVVTDNHGHSCLITESPCPWYYPDPVTAVTITATPDGSPSSQYVAISGACTWDPTGQGWGGGSCSFTAYGGSSYFATAQFTDVN